MTLETELRDTLRAVANTTPVPDRLDAILGHSHRPTRRVPVLVGSGVVVVAVVVALVVGALARVDGKATVVSAGVPRRTPVVVFPHGPSVALDELGRGRLAFVSGSRAYVADANAKTARQLTRSGDASDFAWSSDGSWLAFSVRGAPGYEDYTTWISRADGSGARALAGMSNTFAWSPTGHRLAVAGGCCSSDDAGGLFVADPGHDARRIVDGGSRVSSMAWAPDGSKIGYSAAPLTDTPASVWTVSADGKHAKRIGDGQVAAWSSDGAALLIRDNSPAARITLVRVADGARSALGSSQAFDSRYPAVWSAFSPRGNAIAVVADAGDGIANAIVVCDGNGTGCESHPIDGGSLAGPSFSPDGTQIVFVGRQALKVFTVADARVDVLDRLGRDLMQGAGDGVRVTRGTAPNVPVWLTDGTILYRHGAELRIADPAVGSLTPVASPVGFSDAGAKDQGLPGGTPTASWRLTAR